MRAIALYNCEGEDETEFCFQVGQVITKVETTVEVGWYKGILDGREGVFPGNYVRFEEDPDPLSTTVDTIKPMDIQVILLI